MSKTIIRVIHIKKEKGAIGLVAVVVLSDESRVTLRGLWDYQRTRVVLNNAAKIAKALIGVSVYSKDGNEYFSTEEEAINA